MTVTVRQSLLGNQYVTLIRYGEGEAVDSDDAHGVRVVSKGIRQTRVRVTDHTNREQLDS